MKEVKRSWKKLSKITRKDYFDRAMEENNFQNELIRQNNEKIVKIKASIRIKKGNINSKVTAPRMGCDTQEFQSDLSSSL